MSSLTTLGPDSYLERSSGLNVGSYRGREDPVNADSKTSIPASISSSSHIPHVLAYDSSSSVSLAAPASNRLQWLTHKIEGWFGSSERFESNLVQVSRVVIVDSLTYPFTVFSHQCQFYPYNTVRASVLTAPFSTLVVLNSIANSQGMAALWRGWRSRVLLLLAQPFLDALLTKLFLSTGSPRGLKHWLQVLISKSLPYLVTIPLVSYTYLDMVQTTKDKVHVTLGETMVDLPLVRQDEFRRVPILYLATPTILHGLLSTGLSVITHRVARRLFVGGARSGEDAPLTSAVTALCLDYVSMFLADLALYPLETILLRLYCQGMPALADNVQNGLEQTFVSSYYTGLLDCVSGVYDSEGLLGFFKGFSSLLIRYSVHGLLLVLLWRTAHALENRLRQ